MRVIVSAGGTGGHIFPALAIINKIKEKEPKSEILYIGTTDRMESKLIPELGIKYIGVEMKGLNRKNLLKNFEVISSLNKAIKKCKSIIKEFNPDVVLGIGGYITYPVITASTSLGYKTFIHEQNSIPGLSNKLLKNKATVIGVSLEDSLKYFGKNTNVIFTGNPRSEEATNAKKVPKSKYGLSNDKKCVLIVMGSLGSHTINQKMMDILPKFNGKDYEVLFVTGKNYYEEYSKIKLPSNVKIVEFLNDMLGVMKNVDLIVSRAGASTISEITALSLPSILIPSPYVTHNHQVKNALVLKECGAAVLLEEDKLNSNNLINNIDSILTNKEIYNKMKKASGLLSINNSATKIYDILRKTIDGEKHE